MIFKRKVPVLGMPFCFEYADQKKKRNIGYVLGTSLGSKMAVIWNIYMRS